MREIPPLSEFVTKEQLRRFPLRRLNSRERMHRRLHRMAASSTVRERQAHWNMAKQDFRVVQEDEAKAEQGS